MKEIGLLFMRKLTETRRNPVFIGMCIMNPILYLTLFAPLLKNLAATSGFPTDNVLTVFVPGMLTLLAFSGGIFAGFGIIDELRSGVLERLRVTPTNRFSLLAGPVLRDITVTLASGLLLVCITFPIGYRTSITGLSLTLILLALLVATTSAFGNALGLITKNEDKLAPVVHGMNLPIMLLSGMMLPMKLAPTWLKTIAYFNPVYYVVEANRHLAIGDLTDPMVVYAFLIMIPLTCFTTWWATTIFSKAVL